MAFTGASDDTVLTALPENGPVQSASFDATGSVRALRLKEAVEGESHLRSRETRKRKEADQSHNDGAAARW